ncbi:MAG: D-aminoacylase [Gemmatimonadaceae bacterium]|nr:D-aminoacylase [Gemmatimonadaceae bacterium]
MSRSLRLLPVATLLLVACRPGALGTTSRTDAPYDVVITNGRIVDGTGNAWYRGDVGIRGDRIVRIALPGALANAKAASRVDARDHIIAPGFIDIQAQSYENFLVGDGLALGMVTQGITTAILGEGSTPAPLTAHGFAAAAKADTAFGRVGASFQGARGFGNWLSAMERHGVSQNVGSFLGTSTVRQYAKDESMGAPTAAELDTMRRVVRDAMRDGAFGLASALIYPPDNYSSTADLVEMARAASPFGGVYITHMRSEGAKFVEAVDEAITIGREGRVPVEIYHLKAGGVRNWPKMATVIAKIDSARAAGQDVAADMYLYPAGGNALASCFPPKYAEGGKLLARLRDPATRAEIKAAMLDATSTEELLCREATPSGVMIVGFTKPELKQYEGKRLSEIATAMGKDWVDTAIELTLAEEGRLGEILFLMSEENIRRQLQLPWMKFGTDAGGMAPDPSVGAVHPRTFGNYPRLFGKYVREEKVLPLEDAVRKSSSAVAARLGIRDRGVIAEGMKADIIVFDATTIRDRATFEQPHQLSEGIEQMWVNGVAVLRDGKHTGAKPGRVVRGPGYQP